jgi:hypothetical protein
MTTIVRKLPPPASSSSEPHLATLADELEEDEVLFAVLLVVPVRLVADAQFVAAEEKVAEQIKLPLPRPLCRLYNDLERPLPPRRPWVHLDDVFAPFL